MKQEGSNPQLPTLPPHMYTKNSPVCELSHPTDDFQPTLTTNNFHFSSPTKKKNEIVDIAFTLRKVASEDEKKKKL